MVGRTGQAVVAVEVAASRRRLEGLLGQELLEKWVGLQAREERVGRGDGDGGSGRRWGEWVTVRAGGLGWGWSAGSRGGCGVGGCGMGGWRVRRLGAVEVVVRVNG